MVDFSPADLPRNERQIRPLIEKLEHNGERFSVDRLPFPNRQAATAFAQRQQFGRRNQESNWLAYQRGARYRDEKQAEGAPVGNRNAEKQLGNESQKPCPVVSTADKVAAESGVAARTVKNDAAFAAAVDVLVEAGAPKQRVMEQPKAAVVKAAKLPDDQRVAVATFHQAAPGQSGPVS